jgi:hypothetical protein
MVNDPKIPIEVNEAAIIIGVFARGMRIFTTMRNAEAPQSFADSISASGIACSPELIIRIANGSDVQTVPITIADGVEVRVGKLIPM